MRHAFAALVLFVPISALAGNQINVDLDTTPFYCQFAIAEGVGGIAPGTDNASCTQVVPSATAGVSSGLLNTGAGGGNMYVPANKRLVITEWGVLVTSALVATEDCNLVLQTDTTTAGAGATVSTLTTGPGATETECTTGANIVDAVGESCVINNFTAVIPGGGFWRVRWDDNDGGGANTCTAWTGGTVWVRGLLQPQ